MNSGQILAFFVTVLVTGDFFANTFITPLVTLEAPGFLQLWLPFDFILLALDWLLFAASTVRARVYSRAASWLLLVGAVAALVPIPLTDLPFEATLAGGSEEARSQTLDDRRRQ